MGIPTIACLLDIEKAFDCVWHDGLILKLIKFKFHPHLVKIIKSFITDRYFRVNIKEEFSESLSVVAGVPQGSVLAPLLYTLFTCDFPKPIISNPRIYSIHFADDIIIFLSSRNIKRGALELNHYLNTIQQYFEKWKMKVNTQKCDVITFKGNKITTRRQNKLINQLDIKINQATINNTTTVKYLGVNFTSDLKPYSQIKSAISKATSAFHAIKAIINNKCSLSKKIKLICYKQLIRPILIYGFPAWNDLSSAQMEKLRAFERKMLRKCLNINRKPDSYETISNVILYREADINRIDKFLIDSCLKFTEKCNDSENIIIKNLTNIAADQYDEKYRPPAYLLHLCNINQLLNEEDQLIHFHRSLRDASHLVYNINQ